MLWQPYTIMSQPLSNIHFRDFNFLKFLINSVLLTNYTELTYLKSYLVCRKFSLFINN